MNDKNLARMKCLGKLKKYTAMLFMASCFFGMSVSASPSIKPVADKEKKEQTISKSPLTKRIVRKSKLVKRIISEEYITYQSSLRETRLAFENYKNERIQLFIIEANLADKGLSLRTLLPENGKALGKAQTVSAMVKAANSVDKEILAAVNGDFYIYANGGYFPQSILIKDTLQLKDAKCASCTFFGINKKGLPVIGGASATGTDLGVSANDMTQAVGGFHWLVNEKGAVESADTSVHPRTAVAVKGKKVYFLIVDGRAPGYSQGIDLRDMGILLNTFAKNSRAINLDGGGSTTYVVKDVNGWKVVNRPSGGKERAVANGISIIRTNAK